MRKALKQYIICCTYDDGTTFTDTMTLSQMKKVFGINVKNHYLFWHKDTGKVTKTIISAGHTAKSLIDFLNTKNMYESVSFNIQLPKYSILE